MHYVIWTAQILFGLLLIGLFWLGGQSELPEPLADLESVLIEQGVEPERVAEVESRLLAEHSADGATTGGDPWRLAAGIVLVVTGLMGLKAHWQLSRRAVVPEESA